MYMDYETMIGGFDPTVSPVVIGFSINYNISKGQELVESVINLLQWMRKWSKSKSSEY